MRGWRNCALTIESVAAQGFADEVLPANYGPVALFLDVDGTLLDLAERPERVVTPAGLISTLARTERKLGGALALISGRPLDDLDRLFAPLRLRASGVHGAEVRFDPDAPAIPSPQASELPASLWTALTAALKEFPGVFAENKRYSFAIHYRQAPHAGAALRKAVTRLVEAEPRIPVEVMAAHCAIELKAPGLRQGPGDRGVSLTSRFCRPRAGFHRRRCDRRSRLRRRLRARRPGLFGRTPAPLDGRRLRAAPRRSRLARRVRGGEGRRMTQQRQTRTQNLDLALIGNSCAAALIDRNARIVWWCFPYFDSDPVFSRLLAGDEEKGFCDVALAGLVETESRYLRNTAIVETILTDDERGEGADHRFCAAIRSFRAPVPAAADHPPDRASRGFAASCHSRSGDPQLRAPDDQRGGWLQSHPLCRRVPGHAADDRRAALLHRQ